MHPETFRANQDPSVRIEARKSKSEMARKRYDNWDLVLENMGNGIFRIGYTSVDNMPSRGILAGSTREMANKVFDMITEDVTLTDWAKIRDAIIQLHDEGKIT